MQPNYLLVFWRFPPGNASTKDSKLCVPGSRQVCQSFQFCGGVPGCWYYPTQSGMQKVSFGGGALIFPPGHPALALALFYQIWPCPCKCPNGHKNGICGCFYPKSAISCRDCPTNPPKSLCTPPTKSYKFVSANPCETDAGRINKYDCPGCVGGSFWNFIRFRDFPEMVRNLSVIFAHARCHCPLSALACHLPRPGESFLVGEALAFRRVFQQTQISFIENDTSLPRAPTLGELARQRLRGQAR